MTTILVTGASGNLGSALLPRLAAGFEVRPMSRRARPGWVAADLSTGTGVSDAIRGADVVVHLASSPTKTRRTDVDGTRRLLAPTVKHFVYVSIIGVDRVPLPYYRMKLAAERVVAASGVPYTILRAAQFPQLIDALLKMPVIDRSLLFQPVAVEDVAARIVELVAAPPVEGIVELAGPERLTLGELARDAPRVRVPIRIPGRIAGAIRAGALTTDAEPRGVRTWRDRHLD
jgi:uncharacterized protein YbjT (DUF2867 family)